MVVKGHDKKARSLLPADIKAMEKFHAQLEKQNVKYSFVESYEDEYIHLMFAENDTTGQY